MHRNKLMIAPILSIALIGCVERQTERVPGSVFTRIIEEGPSDSHDNCQCHDNTPLTQEPIEIPSHHEELFQLVTKGNIEGTKQLLLEHESETDLIQIQTPVENESLLILATKFNYITLVRFLLESGIDTDLEDHEGHDAIWHAENQGFELLASYLKGELSDETLGKGFLSAVTTGNLEKIATLLDLGADIEFKDQNKRGALILALSGSILEVVKFLVEKGINTELEVRGGRKMQAAEYAKRTKANPEIVAYLESL